MAIERVQGAKGQGRGVLRQSHRREAITLRKIQRSVDFDSIVTNLWGNIFIYKVGIMQLYLSHRTILKVK